MLNIVIFEDDPKFACYLQQLIYPYLDTAKAEVDICNVTSFLEILKQTADKLTESAIFLLDFVIYEGRTEKDSGAMAQYIHSLNPGHVIIYITGYSGRLEDTTPLKLICTNIIRKQSKQLEWEIRYSIKAALDLLRKKGALIHSGMDRVDMDYNNILFVQSNKRTYKTMIRHVDGYLDSNYTLAEMMAVKRIVMDDNVVDCPEKWKYVICPVCQQCHLYSERHYKNVCLDCLYLIKSIIDNAQYTASNTTAAKDVQCPLCGKSHRTTGLAHVCPGCGQEIVRYIDRVKIETAIRALTNNPYNPEKK